MVPPATWQSGLFLVPELRGRSAAPRPARIAPGLYRKRCRVDCEGHNNHRQIDELPVCHGQYPPALIVLRLSWTQISADRGNSPAGCSPPAFRTDEAISERSRCMGTPTVSAVQ
jgi:hypothetical protein